MEQHHSKNFDLKTVRSFYNVPTAQSGIFTTVGPTFRQSQIRNSCIQHLPGHYNKIDISSKLDFVVVFQTIEIERLSLQVENLRVMLKDSERQISNYLNYEVQIRELSESCHQLEQQVINYQSELQKMSLACNALYEEGRQTKRGYEREIDAMKKQLNSNRNEMQRENDQLKGKVTQLEDLLRQNAQSEQQNQRKTKLISQQLVRLNQNLLLGQNEIGELRQNFAAKSRELQRCLQELQQWRDCAEQEKLKRTVSEEKRVKSEENCQMIKGNHQELIRQFENAHEERQRLQEELQNRGGYIEQTHKQLQNRDKEIEQYKTQLDSYEQELDNLKRAFNDYAGQLQNEKKVNEKLRQQLNKLQRQAEQVKKQSVAKDSSNKQLIHNLNSMKNEFVSARSRQEELNRFIAELKSRIEQGINEIGKCKQILQAYDAEIAEGAMREQHLHKQIETLQVVLQENNQIKDMIFQINAKLGQKDDEIFAKDQHITDLTIENKELFHQGQALKSNIQTVNQNLQQLQTTIAKQRQVFQSQKSKLTDQFQKILNKQTQQKTKIQRELQKVKQEGLIQDSTKRDIQTLKDLCQNQAQQIKNMNGILQSVPKIMTKLKQNNKQHNQVQKINNILRKQLGNSISMNQQLVDKITEQLMQINGLMEEISNLQQKLRYEQDKNDQFAMLSRNSRQKSQQSDRTMISTQPTQTQYGPKSSSPSTNFSSRDRFSPNQTNPTLPRPPERSFINYDINFRNGKSSIVGGIGGNGGIGGIGGTSNADSVFKSAMIGEGVLYESKRVLQPSSYFPSRQSNNTGYRETTFSAYEQFKRDRRI